MRKALLGVALALWLAPAAHAAGATRILYAGDWSGHTEIYAVDPAGRKPLAQITTARTSRCGSAYPITCGFFEPVASPDGRRIVYRTTGSENELWLANAEGTGARLLATPGGMPEPGSAYAAWSPDSRRLAYGASDGYHLVRRDGSSAPGDARVLFMRWNRRALLAYTESVVSPDGRWVASAGIGGISLTNRRTKRTQLLVSEMAFSPSWAPDGRSLAYVSGYLHSGTSRPGDLRVVTLLGKVRTLVRREAQYGGQIVSVTWTRAPAKARYRPPAPVDGVYAGGEVARLAADGSRVAFAACNGVYVWTPPERSPSIVEPNTFGGELCFPPSDRVQVYDLALSGDRVAWARTGGGLTPHMELRVQVLGTAQKSLIAEGGTQVGGHQRGVGTLAGADGFLVYSTWDGSAATGAPPGEAIVTTETIKRVLGTACPCPAIGSWPGLGAPLDVDGGRIVVKHAFWGDDSWTSRRASLAVLDATGTELLSLPVDAAAARLSGADLLVLVRGRLLRYDAASGQLLSTYALPDVPVARDCLFWSGPECPSALRPHLILQDAARGLAAYTLDGQVYVLRLADGRSALLGYGNEARFMDAGLAYADGARIRLVPFAQLQPSAFSND